MLKRILDASSNPGDAVLDPFCGWATTCIAPEMAEQRWTGIDISPKAAELVRQRMLIELNPYHQGVIRTDVPQRADLGNLPRYNSQANRHKLCGLQEGNCAGCNCHFEARHLEVDHIIARQKGGRNHIDNLQRLCGNCNRIKGNRGIEYLKSNLQIRAA